MKSQTPRSIRFIVMARMKFFARMKPLQYLVFQGTISWWSLTISLSLAKLKTINSTRMAAIGPMYNLRINSRLFSSIFFLKFSNKKIQAARAKEQHGKVFSGFMLGVMPCLDETLNQSVLDESGENLEPSTLDSSDRFGSIRNASVLTPMRDRTQVFNSVNLFLTLYRGWKLATAVLQWYFSF